jgi:hypothetical protein
MVAVKVAAKAAKANGPLNTIGMSVLVNVAVSRLLFLLVVRPIRYLLIFFA